MPIVLYFTIQVKQTPLIKEFTHLIGIKKFLTFKKSCKFNGFEYHFQLFYGKNNSPFDMITSLDILV